MKKRYFMVVSDKIFKSLFFLSFFTPPLLATFDTTPFYRAALFQGAIQSEQRNWSSVVHVQYAYGTTEHSFNSKHDTTALFNAHGLFDVSKLGINLEGLTEENKPLTWLYLRGIDDDLGLMTDLGLRTTAGLFQFDGELETDQIVTFYQQNLFSGFYLQALIPLRKVELDSIESCYKGEELSGEDLVTFNAFLQNLDAILEENNLKPLTTCFHREGLSDIVISGGWQGYNDNSFGIIDALQGYIQLGILIPTGKRSSRSRVFSLPLGYEGLWGVHTRFALQAHAFSVFSLGVHGGITTLFDKEQKRRVATSEEQNGWILFEKAKVKVNGGAIWDIGGYLKADHILFGLSFLFGYTFTKQETTELYARDRSDYLATFVGHQKDLDPPVIVSRDEVLNSDRRLKEWEEHGIHILGQYDFKIHADSVFAPQIDVSYHTAVWGKHVMRTDMFAGQIGISMHWNV